MIFACKYAVIARTKTVHAIRHRGFFKLFFCRFAYFENGYMENWGGEKAANNVPKPSWERRSPAADYY